MYNADMQGCCLLRGQTPAEERSCRVLLHEWHKGTQTEMTSRSCCREEYIASVSVLPLCALRYMDEGVKPDEDAQAEIHHGRVRRHKDLSSPCLPGSPHA